MKKTLFILAASMVVVNAQSIVNVTNTAFNNELAILDNAGQIVTSGVSIAVGTFDTPADAANPATFGETFTSFGQAAFVPFPAVGQPAAGFFDVAVAGFSLTSAGDGSDFIQENISVIIFEGDSLSDSQAFASFNTDGIFLADSVTNDASSASVTPGNLQFGQLATGTFVIDNGFLGQTTVTNAVQLTFVPEPSAALLAGLALVGGLVRRRR